ncbi:hypothetical protein Lnau_2090 [Legionella nautarum]|uniref:Uncharacterized protein n=1 Tax=Legionella nautarum TaxID=45070 RepID=A0A0W0WNW2_9GAMM|nr:hypothetical protein [Legionella nautarum]KTD33798.1 hypothetical protein Lnau_2090 [Legionella nautarum]
MKKHLASLLMLVSAFFTAPAWSAINANPGNTKNLRFLFVVLAKEGTIEIANREKREFILNLNKVNPQVVYFADRPARFSGQLELKRFLNQWSQGSYKKEPPRALLEVVRLNTINQSGQSASYSIVLGEPSYKSETNQLSMKIYSLPGNAMELPDLAHSDYVALFVDG